MRILLLYLYTYINTQKYIHTRTYICTYGVASISRLLKITGFFCGVSSLLQGSFANDTCNCKEPTNRSHPTRSCLECVRFSQGFEYSLFYRALLQKRPVILRSLLIGATPYAAAQSVLHSLYTYMFTQKHIHTRTYICTYAAAQSVSDSAKTLNIHQHIYIYTYEHMVIYTYWNIYTCMITLNGAKEAALQIRLQIQMCLCLCVCVYVYVCVQGSSFANTSIDIGTNVYNLQHTVIHCNTLQHIAKHCKYVYRYRYTRIHIYIDIYIRTCPEHF